MTSGIYRLNFKSGHYYIGKSKDISRRWKEHTDKFNRGTAAKSMQTCFNMCGHPKQTILYEVHPEHLDVIEPIVIANNWGPFILNTTREECATDMKDEYLDLCKLSLGTLCHKILDQSQHIDQLSNELEQETANFEEILDDIKDGTRLKVVEQQYDALREVLNRKCRELEKLKSRGFIARLFDWRE